VVAWGDAERRIFLSWFRKKARVLDVLTSSFGDGPGALSLVAGSEFVGSFRSIRFTVRSLDYELWRDRLPSYGFGIQIGRADRPGRPEDHSVLALKTLEAIRAYNDDLFYWEDIQVALGDPEISRDISSLRARASDRNSK